MREDLRRKPLATVTADGELVYDRPVKLHAYDYTGPMVHFEGKVVDLLVTPNHSMYLKPKRGSDFEFVPAEDVGARRATTSRRCSGASVDEARRRPRVHSVPRTPLSHLDPGDWCEFLGWYLADGTCRDPGEVALPGSARITSASNACAPCFPGWDCIAATTPASLSRTSTSGRI